MGFLVFVMLCSAAVAVRYLLYRIPTTRVLAAVSITARDAGAGSAMNRQLGYR